MQRTWMPWTFVIWLGLVAFTVLRISTPPPAARLDADGSAQQAVFGHLENIAAQPHPVGSAAHAAVHDYLVASIRALGLPVQTQERPLSAYTDAPRWAPGGSLRNVMTRVPGTRPGKALLLASHYDSAPPSHGAGDDGAAVASMLHLLAETARAGFANDVIFLFTDAEEICLCGARAFMQEHPWAGDVGVVLNFEARGTSGKSVMFEATPGYGRLVQTYAEHAVQPATSSLYQTVYELLPNDTDLTVFREHGIHGLNMAFIDSSHNYHTVADNLANLDRDTAMHQLTNMRAMLLALADADLVDIGSNDLIFFDVFGLHVFTYGYLLAWIGAALATALFCGLFYTQLRQGRLRARQVPVATVLTVLAAGLVVVALTWTSNRLTADAGAMSALQKKLYAGTGIVLAMTALVALARALAQRLGPAAVELGILLVWLLLLVATSVALPKVSYIFLWPLVAVLAGRLVALRTRRFTETIELVAYVPLLVIWTQVAYALLLAMSLAAMHIILAPMMLAAALLVTSAWLQPVEATAAPVRR